VAQAINKQKIVQLVNGRGTPAVGFLPPHLPGYNPRFAGLPYDAAAAREQLRKAGFQNGFDVTYACVANDTQRKVAQAIQQDLAQVGIRVTIKPMAFPTYLQAKSTRGQVAIGSGNWSQDYPDPSNFLITLFHSKHIRDADSLNDSFYANPEVDRLFDLSEKTTPEAERFALLQQAEALIVEDAPVVPLYHPVKYHLVASRIVGYALHPVWGLELRGAGLL
jgi:ABC-type transport system substrate-binding protein